MHITKQVLIRYGKAKQLNILVFLKLLSADYAIFLINKTTTGQVAINLLHSKLKQITRFFLHLLIQEFKNVI